MRKIHINRKFIALIVSIALGLVGVLGLKKVIDTKLNKANDIPMLSMAVAAKDLMEGDILSTDNIASREIPREWAPSSGVLAGDFGNIDGSRLKYAVKAGEPLTYSIIDTTLDISNLIPLGRRAITIPVDDESSISSMLKPGDLIDLIVTLQRDNRAVTIPLMLGVRVLATGNIVDNYQSTENGSNYTNITLDVSTEDAKNIILATTMGRITAILRNPNDQIISDTAAFIKSIQSQSLSKPYLEDIPQSIKNPIAQPATTKPESDSRSQSNINIIYGNVTDE